MSRSSVNKNPERPDYGIDAPGLVRGFLGAAAAGIVLSFAAGFWLQRFHPWHLLALAVLGTAATYAVCMAGLMLFWSKVTKVKGRETILNRIVWRGDETVLDVGCGRGLMLVGAARRLSSGRATGIDIWQAQDQSANTAAGALENARLEGVRDKVEVQTADMRALPFADQSFDVVLSHWVVHNLKSEADRSRALAEMVRVLRLDGWLVLADIEHRSAYCAQLKALGLTDVQVIFSPMQDMILKAVSFGSFQPATIFARRASLALGNGTYALRGPIQAASATRHGVHRRKGERHVKATRTIAAQSTSSALAAWLEGSAYILHQCFARNRLINFNDAFPRSCEIASDEDWLISHAPVEALRRMTSGVRLTALADLVR